MLKYGQKANLKFCKTQVSEEGLDEALDILSATAQVALDLLKTLVIPLDRTARNSAVTLKVLKLH